MKEENVEGGRVPEKRERTETIVAWAVVAFLVAIMFIRVFIAIWTVGDRPRTWNYRTAPQIPAEAYSSTMPSSTTTENVPSQVVLPPPAFGKHAAGGMQMAPSGPAKGKAAQKTPPASHQPVPAGGPR